MSALRSQLGEVAGESPVGTTKYIIKTSSYSGECRPERRWVSLTSSKPSRGCVSVILKTVFGDRLET